MTIVNEVNVQVARAAVLDEAHAGDICGIRYRW